MLDSDQWVIMATDARPVDDWAAEPIMALVNTGCRHVDEVEQGYPN